MILYMNQPMVAIMRTLIKIKSITTMVITALLESDMGYGVESSIVKDIDT